MKPALRVMLCDDAGERFFGEGPCRLLHLIEETGSLRSAAAQMGLSYSKALRLVQHAEKELGFALTCKTIGGRGGTYAIPLPRCPDASHRCRPGQMGRDARYSRRGSGGHRPV